MKEIPVPAGALLSVTGLSVAFGGLLALDHVALDVRKGERLAVLGPNGAGKTTLFNAITGDIAPTTGSITIGGVECADLPSRSRPRLGVARTYQRTRLFGGVTVEECLVIAQVGRHGGHLSLRPALGNQSRRERALHELQRVGLEGRLFDRVDTLSHGEQRQVEIATALVTGPDLLMLDEPASGLPRGEREHLTKLLTNLESDLTLVLIEHDMDVALSIADRVVVLADGRLVAEGTPNEIRTNTLVQSIYLGDHGAHT